MPAPTPTPAPAPVEPSEPKVSQPFTHIEQSIVSAVVLIAGLAVSIGVMSSNTEKIIVAIAGIVGAVAVGLFNQLHTRTLAMNNLLRR